MICPACGNGMITKSELADMNYLSKSGFVSTEWWICNWCEQSHMFDDRYSPRFKCMRVCSLSGAINQYANPV